MPIASGIRRSVVVQIGLRAGPVKREILRYVRKTAPLRMTVVGLVKLHQYQAFRLVDFGGEIATASDATRGETHENARPDIDVGHHPSSRRNWPWSRDAGCGS